MTLYERKIKRKRSTMILKHFKDVCSKFLIRDLGRRKATSDGHLSKAFRLRRVNRAPNESTQTIQFHLTKRHSDDDDDDEGQMARAKNKR